MLDMPIHLKFIKTNNSRKLVKSMKHKNMLQPKKQKL